MPEIVPASPKHVPANPPDAQSLRLSVEVSKTENPFMRVPIYNQAEHPKVDCI